MLTVLMIDDDKDLVETVRSHIESLGEPINFQSESDFKKAEQRILEVRPDVMILDWFHGVPGQGAEAGKEVWTNMWKAWFCPVVVYSAGDVDLSGELQGDHPFVKTVEKQSGSEKTVGAHLVAFRPHVDALAEVAKDLDRVKHEVLRDLAAIVYTFAPNETERAGILKRAARRRLAAIMDDLQQLGDDKAQPWEQYIFPVLTKHPIMGDIIRLSDEPATNPSAHRVILTPTCDMVSYGSRACKASHFLVANCGDPKRFLSEGLLLSPKAKKNEVKESLKSALNEAQKSGLIVLPGFAGLIPLMVIDLRKLELIPATEVAGGAEKNKKYQRVASIDSPFREFIGWGYMQVSCRPGVPPRDGKSVIEELSNLWVKAAD